MNLNDLHQRLQQNPEYNEIEEELRLHFELANAVLRARLAKGWSQDELALKIGTKQANISRIEAGLANPTLTIIQKLLKVLDLNLFIYPSAIEKTPINFQSFNEPASSRYIKSSYFWKEIPCEPQFDTNTLIAETAERRQI